MVPFETITVGVMGTNCYLVGGSQLAVIDPGADVDAIMRAVGDRTVKMVLLTHGHFDHIGAVTQLTARTGAPVYIETHDVPMIEDASLNLSQNMGRPIYPFPVNALFDGDTLSLERCRLRVLHTPGHTPGSCCYLGNGAAFVGDLIFPGTIGRTDFPGGDYAAEIASVQKLLNSVPEGTVLCPGHDARTTAGEEKRTNPYYRA